MSIKGNSKKKIIKALSTPKTISQIKVLTQLPNRTLRYNLAKLKNQNVVKEVALFSDMRKKLFALNGDNCE